MRKRSFLPGLFLLLISEVLLAQRIISGIINDEGGEPLIGASVVIKDTDLGTATDIEGRYRLPLPKGARFLIFSYTGFATREIEIDQSDTLDVTLKVSTSFLEEVIVTGVSIGTPTTKVGFNVAKINENQLQEVPGVNAAVALQGKVPGVIVTSSGGMPGSNPSIRIRCTNNLFALQAAETACRLPASTPGFSAKCR